MKRLLLPVLVAFSSLLTVSAAAKLNVLMIAIDDLRPSIGCYGDPNAKTPHMDALAARGLRFERAYCQQALCSPSRISLLSGRRPSTSKIYTIGPTLRSAMPDITTLPQHFKNEGYFTRSLGKVYHVGIDDLASWSLPSWQSPKARQKTRHRAQARHEPWVRVPAIVHATAKNSAPQASTVGTTKARSRNSLRCSHEVSGTSTQP